MRHATHDRQAARACLRRWSLLPLLWLALAAGAWAQSPTILPATLPDAAIDERYDQLLSVSDGGDYEFGLDSGRLPEGLLLDLDGRLHGTPSEAGDFTFTVLAAPAVVTDAPTLAALPLGSVVHTYTLAVAGPTISVSPAALADGRVNEAYAQSITASGGTSPYSYAVSGGSLPTGLVLDPASGAITGTPVEDATFNFLVTATDANGFDGTRSYGVDILPPILVLAPPTLPDAVVGTHYSELLTASGGIAPYGWSVVSGSLPPGLTLAASGTDSAALEGTPASAGSYAFTVMATDAGEHAVTLDYTVVVSSPAIVLSPPSLPGTVVGGDYLEVLSASGGVAPYTYALASGDVPPGISFSSDGTLQGAASQPGSFAFKVLATDNYGSTGAQDYVIEVTAPTIVLSPGSLPDGVVGTPYAQWITASGGHGPYSFALSAGSLLPGLTLDGDGSLEGTPEAPGSALVTIVATDSFGITGEADYLLVVAAPTIVLSPASLPASMVGAEYLEVLSASGGIAPYTFELASGALPPGISFSSDGTLQGAAAEPGSFDFTVRGIDNYGSTGERDYTVVVAPLPEIVITVAPDTVPDATAHVPYAIAFSASGGTAPYIFSIDTPPPGLSLAADGTFAGTPATDGTFPFNVTATDAAGATGSQSYTMEIGAPTLAVSPETLPDGTAGVPYDAVVSASGGLAPYVFAVLGSLPDGLVMDPDSGRISGTPTLAGSFGFPVLATDADGHTATRDYTISVVATPPVAVDDVASTLSQQPVSIAVAANDSGDIASISIAGAASHGSAVVDGLSVTYTPDGSFYGDDSFRYTASGPSGTSSPATVTVHVSPLPVPAGVPQSLHVAAGETVAFDAAAGASGGPITVVTIVQPPEQGTASVAGTTISYTAPGDATGTQSVGYVLSNAYGDSAPVVSTIAIDAKPVAPALQATTPMGIAVELDLTAGASGGPFVDATVQDVSPAGAGTAMLLDDGDGGFRLRFTPAPAFSGEATIGFTLSNAHATSAPGSAVITVTERDNPALDPQVGGVVRAQVSTVRDFAQAQINNVQQRLDELHEPGSGPWGFWIGGSVRHGDRRGNGNVAPASFETSGLTSGADYRFSERFAFGGALGHARDRTAIGDEGSRSDARAESAMGYGSFKPPSMPFYLDGLAGHQRITFQLQRVDPVSGDVVSMPRDGIQSFSSWSSGYEHKADTWMLASYGRMDVAQARLDAYQEQGDPLEALAFDEMAVQTRTSTLGLRGRFQRKIRWGMLEPKFRIEFQRDFHDASGAVIRYADQEGGQAYVMPTTGIDRSRAIIELGGILRTVRGMVLRLELRSVRGGGTDNDNAISFSFQDDH